LSIKSNCDEEITLLIKSELAISQKTFLLQKGENKTITVTASAIDSVLGVYPLQIINKKENVTLQTYLIDYIIYSPDSKYCFELSGRKAIFDLSEENVAKGAITNKCLVQRKDGYLPELTISTKSVSLDYNKPVLPSSYNFDVNVHAGAVESYVSGLIKSNAYAMVQNRNINGLDVVGTFTDVDKIYKDTVQSNPPLAGFDCYHLFSQRSKQVAFCNQTVKKIESENDTYLSTPIPVVQSNPLSKETMPFDWSTTEILNIVTEQNSNENTLSKENKNNQKLFFSKANGILENVELTPGQIENIYVQDDNPPAPDLSNEEVRFNQKGAWQAELFYDWAHNPKGNSAVKVPAPVGFYEEKDATFLNNLNHNNQTVLWASDATNEFIVLGVDKLSIIPAGTESRIDKLYYSPGINDGGKIYALFTFHNPVSATDTCVTSRGQCGDLGTAIDWINVAEHQILRQSNWSNNFTIVPIEGKVFDLGPYSASPTPLWLTLTDYPDGESPIGRIWTQKNQTCYTFACAKPLGFVNIAGARSRLAPKPSTSKAKWIDLPYVNGPYNDKNAVEYNADGTVYYTLWPFELSKYPELKFYLYNKHIYAEYVGISKIKTKRIDFNLVNENVYGEKYATIVVRDWAKGEKKQQAFRVKLVGKTNSCVASDGTVGATGKEFAPKLKFNWDWGTIEKNQCDLANKDYTYCDATQFTISLIKKLNDIDQKILEGSQNQTPKLTAFYSYLTKDNYSESFLNDFLDYYTTVVTEQPNYFSSKTNDSLSNLLANKKLVFEVKNNQTLGTTQNTLLPYGGLYRVEIGLDFINKEAKQLVSGQTPNVIVKITLSPVKKAEDYSSLYELAFDGKVGEKDKTIINPRKDYGISVNGIEVKLSSTEKATTFSSSFSMVNGSSRVSINSLDDGIIFSFNEKSGKLDFSPSQPTPIILKDSTSESNDNYNYTLTDNGTTINFKKEWKYSNSKIKAYSATKEYNRELINSVDYRSGEAYIKTTFFTQPKSHAELVTRGTDIDAISYPLVTVPKTVLLNNLDSRENIGYDSLTGMIDGIANEQLCIGQDVNKTTKIWWNPNYIEIIEDEIS